MHCARILDRFRLWAEVGAGQGKKAATDSMRNEREVSIRPSRLVPVGREHLSSVFTSNLDYRTPTRTQGGS